ncbi:MAG: ParA family protein [Erythrobacter sp.]
MASIAVYSIKGGVGKTTFAVNLAWCAASISRRQTLLWDLDPANGSGFVLDVAPKKKKRASNAFFKNRLPSKLIRKTGYDNLSLLPADESLRLLHRDLAKMGNSKRLAKITKSLSKEYDRIIFDCPPVLNEVSEQVIRAADLVIVPLPPSPLSTRAFDQVVEIVKGSGKKHPPILPVLSMMDMRRTLHRVTRETNPKWPAIPLSSALEQCAVRQSPVGAFDSRSVSAQAFARLWTAIERKLAKR